MSENDIHIAKTEKFQVLIWFWLSRIDPENQSLLSLT